MLFALLHLGFRTLAFLYHYNCITSSSFPTSHPIRVSYEPRTCHAQISGTLHDVPSRDLSCLAVSSRTNSSTDAAASLKVPNFKKEA